MNAFRATLCLTAVSVLLSGCASGVRLDEPAPVESRTTGSTGADGSSSASGTSQSGVTSVDLTGNNASMAANNLPRVVYFDLDSFVVKDEYLGVVEANAKLLAADRARRLQIEGHTDERGGREYNLALGQKRAEAVAKSLAVLGASANQLEAVSFGKERPAVSGSGEEAWAKNRRAELKPR